MRKNILFTALSLISVMLFFGVGCSKSIFQHESNNNTMEPYIKAARIQAAKVDDASFQAYITKNKTNIYLRACEVFSSINKTSIQQSVYEKKAVSCISSVSEEYMPFLVKKVLAHQPAVSKTTLTKILEEIAYGFALHLQSIKDLIKAGASTENIDLARIKWGNSRVCKSLNLILKNNKQLYQNILKTKSKPFQREALHYLAVSGMEIELCDKEIRLLASYNPALLDYRGRYNTIPLTAYIAEPIWDNWKVETAKILMTKKNINYQDGYGNVPLFALGSGSGSLTSPFDKAILKAAISKGADLTIKNKKGLSYKGYILSKRPDLLGFVKDGKRLYSCFHAAASKLDTILTTKEEHELLTNSSYLSRQIKLENSLIKRLPLPSKDKCVQQFFDSIDINNTHVMARVIMDAYKTDFREKRANSYR